MLILLVAVTLRGLPLMQNRFHPDEALYAHYAQRIASGEDILLQGVMVDKPPLLFYLAGISLAWLGPTAGGEPLKAEFAVRLPSFFASLLAVALTWRLTRDLYRHRPTAGIAALTLALSPMAILFGITVFLDPLMLALVLAAILTAWRGHWTWAGLWFLLAIAAKQTALLFLPLLLALAVLSPHWRWTAAHARSVLLRFGLTNLAGAALLFGWDALRQPDLGFWAQGVNQNLPRRLIRSMEVPIRFDVWAGWFRYHTGSDLLNGLGIAGGIGLTLRALTLGNQPEHRRTAALDLVLLAYLLGFFAGYWLLAFATWDRYLLGLGPIIAILLARSLTELHHTLRRLNPPWPRLGVALTTVAFVALLIQPAWIAASRSGFPVGGDHGAYDGLDQVAAFFDDAPPGTVVYDYWLSWQFNFYLFDAPVYVAWQPGPAALATDLLAFSDSGPRYFVAPAWTAYPEFLHAIDAAGFTATEAFTATGRDDAIHFYIFEIHPAPP